MGPEGRRARAALGTKESLQDDLRAINRTGGLRRATANQFQGLLTRQHIDPSHATAEQVTSARNAYRAAVEEVVDRRIGGQPNTSTSPVARSWKAGALAVKTFTLDGELRGDSMLDTRLYIADEVAADSDSEPLSSETVRTYERKVLDEAADLVAAISDLPDLRTTDVEDLVRNIETLYVRLSIASSLLNDLHAARETASSSTHCNARRA
jgi:hypothetical protein